MPPLPRYNNNNNNNNNNVSFLQRQFQQRQVAMLKSAFDIRQKTHNMIEMSRRNYEYAILNRCVFRLLSKMSMDWAHLMVMGSAFQREGAACAKQRFPPPLPHPCVPHPLANMGLGQNCLGCVSFWSQISQIYSYINHTISSTPCHPFPVIPPPLPHPCVPHPLANMGLGQNCLGCVSFCCQVS